MAAVSVNRQTRLTDWRPGDVVRVTSPSRQHARGEYLPIGSIGVLGEMYRIQDGYECWAFWQGSRLSAIVHAYAERCSGPVQWRSCFESDVDFTALETRLFAAMGVPSDKLAGDLKSTSGEAIRSFYNWAQKGTR